MMTVNGDWNGLVVMLLAVPIEITVIVMGCVDECCDVVLFVIVMIWWNLIVEWVIYRDEKF
jgi:hypothetical protein